VRLLRSIDFLTDRRHLILNIVAVFINETAQRLLFLILKAESRSQPDMRRYSKRVGMGVRHGGVHSKERMLQQDGVPGAVLLAEGSIVQRMLGEGRGLIVKDTSDAPMQVQAFRQLVCPEFGTQSWAVVVVAVWRSLLPCHAQLWFRLYRQVAQLYPFKLLRLALHETSLDAKRRIAEDLLTVPDCCLDPAFSVALRQMALESDANLSGQVSFLVSDYCIAIIRAWAEVALPWLKTLPLPLPHTYVVVVTSCTRVQP
jgi:hypothetical protein